MAQAALSLGVGIASAALAYPMINGFEFSYASVEAIFVSNTGLLKVKAIKSATYSAPTEIQKLWGTHVQPIAQTVGKQDFEGEIEIYLSAAIGLQAFLGPGWSQVFFSLSCTFSSAGQPIVTDLIKGCRLTSPEGPSITSGSTDGLTRKYKLNPMDIAYGGIAMIQNPLAGLLT